MVIKVRLKATRSFTVTPPIDYRKTLGLKNTDEIKDLTKIAKEASGDACDTVKVI